MKSTEFITEIGHCDNVSSLKLPDEEIIFWSTVVGDIEGADIHRFESHSQELFFMHKDGKISAFVILIGNDIRGMQNISKIGGQISAILIFLVHTLKKKLHIANTELLSSDGITWLTSAISAGGRGLKFTDQTGELPNVSALRREWNHAAGIDSSAGNTEIFIESKIRVPLRPKSDFQNRLMNTYKILFNKDYL